ncbi:MAG: sodium:proton exchanger [Candidatus Cloacimonetes bacterium HGW-Cloacimonetes-2]|jgi:cation:H+ antiporter|nr:MAG: sodium:proton exchanger [Candidatus Cloacimonetes bacterium HGW-Cloacimonetes-2]
MILFILLIALGFALLIGGADILVRGASSLALRLKVPDLVIGLTVVAFGTSTPELVVNLVSAFKGTAGIAFGNVIGSNLFNILGILGICSLVMPLQVKTNTTWREIPFALMTSFILLILVNDSHFVSGAKDILTWGDGLVLLGFFAIFLVYTHNLSKQGAESESSSRRYSLPISLAFIAGGLIGLILGGNLVVTFAVKLARLFGMSESVIGLTIVAIGTSLPELSTSLVAAIRKKPDIAVGNVIGSNIFNLLFVMGITSLVSPMPYDRIFNPGQFVMIGSTLLLFIMMFNPKRHRLDRWEGAILLIIYILYSVLFLK